MDSPSFILNRLAPSRATQPPLLPSLTFSILISDDAGKIRGRKLRECGAKGVKHIQCVLVSMIEPPEARLYAVEPVGVDIINPSPTEHVILLPSM